MKRVNPSKRQELSRGGKRGFLLPLIVVIGSTVLTLAVPFLSSRFFESRRAAVAAEQSAYYSAEWWVLSRFREESELMLREKDAQIRAISDRLSELQRRRLVLVKLMQSDLEELERQLESAAQQTLASERERLRAQNLSEAEIDQRLADLAGRLRAENEEKLDEQRRISAVSYNQRSEELLGEIDRISLDLERSYEERKQLILERRRREEQLVEEMLQDRRQLQQRSLQAERSLARLQELKEREDLLASQIVGIYERFEERFDARSYDEAQQALAALQELLFASQIEDLPRILQRRPGDAAAIRVLEQYMTALLLTSQVQESLVIDTAALLLSARKRIAEARELYQAGRIVEAENLYYRTIGTMPAIQRAFEAVETIGAERTRELLERYNREAAVLVELGRFTQAADSYREALQQLSPVYREELLATAEGVRNVSEAEAEIALAEQQRRNANLSAAMDRLQETLSAAEEQTALLREQIREQRSENRRLQTLLAQTTSQSHERGRKEALQDATELVFYLAGYPTEDDLEERLLRLMQSEESFQRLVREVQDLANQGLVRTELAVAELQLLGVLASLDGNRGVVELLTRAEAEVGDTVRIRRRLDDGEEIDVTTGSVVALESTRIILALEAVEESRTAARIDDLVYRSIRAQ